MNKTWLLLVMAKYLINRFLPFNYRSCINRIHYTSIVNPVRRNQRELLLMHYHRSGINVALVDVYVLTKPLDVSAASMLLVIVAQPFNNGLLKTRTRHFHLRDPCLINF